MEETLLLPIRVESKEVVYRDRNQTIQNVVAYFEGFSKEYFVCDHGERTALVAVWNDNVLLTRQYRLLINRLSYEIPGGRVDPGESSSIAAQRECFEETGVQCLNLQPLIAYHAGLDIWKNYTHVFYSEVCHDASEYVDKRVWVPLEKCMEMIFTGQIQDSLSISALLAFYYAKKIKKTEK